MHTEDSTHNLQGVHLVALDPDHPGFRDTAYRRRRDAIAKIASGHVRGAPVPRAPYTEAEHAVWERVFAGLAPEHERRVAPEVQRIQRAFPLDPKRIPQLVDLNQGLHEATGFRMEPVPGLVMPRDFLTALGDGVFHSTQYIRHASRPWYTPEPDVIHELIGHAATLFDPDLAALNRAFGDAARDAGDRRIEQLIRVYWFTLEFGLVEQGGTPRAVGAGLLSSVDELRGCVSGPELRGWDVNRIAETSFDPSDLQPVLFVAPSYRSLLDDVGDWLSR